MFQHTKGVTNAVSGYAGGQKQTAHYEQVGSGRSEAMIDEAVSELPRRLH